MKILEFIWEIITLPFKLVLMFLALLVPFFLISGIVLAIFSPIILIIWLTVKKNDNQT